LLRSLFGTPERLLRGPRAAIPLLWQPPLKMRQRRCRGGLKAGEREGTPISAKFEIDDGKLQLSVYTMKGDDFVEVVADPKTGAVTEVEKIKDADDLTEATAQKAAMAKAKLPLLTVPRPRSMSIPGPGR
jgi:hypothetical protein